MFLLRWKASTYTDATDQGLDVAISLHFNSRFHLCSTAEATQTMPYFVFCVYVSVKWISLLRRTRRSCTIFFPSSSTMCLCECVWARALEKIKQRIGSVLLGKWLFAFSWLTTLIPNGCVAAPSSEFLPSENVNSILFVVGLQSTGMQRHIHKTQCMQEYWYVIYNQDMHSYAFEYE